MNRMLCWKSPWWIRHTTINVYSCGCKILVVRFSFLTRFVIALCGYGSQRKFSLYGLGKTMSCFFLFCMFGVVDFFCQPCMAVQVLGPMSGINTPGQLIWLMCALIIIFYPSNWSCKIKIWWADDEQCKCSSLMCKWTWVICTHICHLRQRCYIVSCIGGNGL